MWSARLSHPPAPSLSEPCRRGPRLRAMLLGSLRSPRGQAGRSGRACPARAVARLAYASQVGSGPRRTSVLVRRKRLRPNGFSVVWTPCSLATIHATGGRVTLSIREESRHSAEGRPPLAGLHRFDMSLCSVLASLVSYSEGPTGDFIFPFSGLLAKPCIILQAPRAAAEDTARGRGFYEKSGA